MDLIAGEYGWSDQRILGLTLARLRQVVAAIQRRRWLADLEHRRTETAKLRALCTYIAATMQLGEGDNPMLDAAAELNLGTGTENPNAAPAAAPTAPEPGPAGPHARVGVAGLPDAPPSVRAGQAAPRPAGVGGRPLPLEKLGSLLGGGR